MTHAKAWFDKLMVRFSLTILTFCRGVRGPKNKNSKHEIRNSKQFQIIKICKNVNQASFGFGVLDFPDLRFICL